MTQQPDPLAGHTLAAPVPVLIALVDHAQARFFLDDERGLAELAGVVSPHFHGSRFHTLRSGAPGRGERRYHGIRAEEARRHYKRVARQVRDTLRGRRAIGVILGGSHRVLAELKESLPVDVRRVVLRELSMGPRSVRRLTIRQAAERTRHFMA